MRLLARLVAYRLVPRGSFVGDLVGAWAIVAVALAMWAVVPGPVGVVLAAFIGLAALGAFVDAFRGDDGRHGGLP